MWPHCSHFLEWNDEIKSGPLHMNPQSSNLGPNDINQRYCTKISLWKLPRNTWWRHQMETFSALLAICAGNSPVTGEFPAQRPVTRSFDFFFDLHMNKRLSKQSWGWWFETPSRSLCRHCNEYVLNVQYLIYYSGNKAGALVMASWSNKSLLKYDTCLLILKEGIQLPNVLLWNWTIIDRCI